MNVKSKLGIALLSLFCFIVISGSVAQILTLVKKEKEQPIGTSTQDRVSFDLMGTPTASTTLTTSYVDNRVTTNAQYMENLHLDIRYSPATTTVNHYVLLMIEGSNDNGVNFFPISSKVIGTDEIDMYTSSTLNQFTQGIPIVFPANKITFGSSTYSGQYDQDIVADHVRVSAREMGGVASGSVSGYIYIRATFSSKQ